MPVEAGHIQITEFSKEVFPQINWMMEDLFCKYGVSMPYFLLDFDFPDYSQRPDWVTYSPPDWYLPEWENYWPTFINQWPNWFEGTGFNFNLDWGPWGYWLSWFNELLGLLHDMADLPRLTLPDLSPASAAMLNDYVNNLYGSVTAEYSPLPGGGYYIRRGEGTNYTIAKSDYEDDPSYSGPSTYKDVVVTWRVDAIAITEDYLIRAYQSYAAFDTRNTMSVNSVKFVMEYVYVTLQDVTENPVLYIYKFDYGDAVDSEDWTGGELIKQREFTEEEDDSDEIEISINPSDVTRGGYSKFMFSLEKIVNLDYWTDPGVPGQADHTVTCTTLKLVIN